MIKLDKKACQAKETLLYPVQTDTTASKYYHNYVNKTTLPLRTDNYSYGCMYSNPVNFVFFVFV